jgi:hypothetical protein
MKKLALWLLCTSPLALSAVSFFANAVPADSARKGTPQPTFETLPASRTPQLDDVKAWVEEAKTLSNLLEY